MLSLVVLVVKDARVQVHQLQVQLVVTLTRLVELLQLTLVVLRLQMHKDRAETYHHTILLPILYITLKVGMLQRDKKEKQVQL